MSWLLWGLVLSGYDASTTFLSRACNSGSLRWHAIASMVSNLLYLCRYIFLLENGLEVIRTGNLSDVVLPVLFFLGCTVAGSVAAHYVSMRWIEKGRREVGARPW